MTSLAMPTLEYRRATQPWELEQIHRLNYQTFVEEIPQHEANAERRLVDRFDGENHYFVACRGDQVVGMVCVRDRRPWSLDAKIPEIDRYLPAGRFLEIRLLAIHPQHRGGAILRGLVAEVARFGLGNGFTGAVISGTTRQLRLYEHMGFTPFGPLVGRPGALYQPMYLTMDALRDFRISAAAPEGAHSEVVSFLPGPVEIHRSVLEAFAQAPISHRAPEFLGELAQLKQTLCAITGARHASVLLGSGTLANDVVAWQLARHGGRGIVFSNGEFGERLVDHATRARLDFEVVRKNWGEPLDVTAVDAALEEHPDASWAWMVHLETSTGMVNALPHLASRAPACGLVVAADCVSAIGSIPVDASALDFATAVSGKGIGSLPGLAVVYHRGPVQADSRVPRYLDLGMYAVADGVPFTQSSNLVRALGVAARRTLLRGRFADVERLGSWLRAELRKQGFRVVAPEGHAAPSIVTIALPASISSLAVGDALLARGFALSYRSGYLVDRNWIQVAVMGECTRAALEQLVEALRGLVQ